MLNEWVRDAALRPDKKFILPLDFNDPTQEVDDVMVCQNSIMNVLYVGRQMIWIARNRPNKKHGLWGKTGVFINRGKQFGEINESLHVFFIELLPFATGLIQ